MAAEMVDMEVVIAQQKLEEPKLKAPEMLRQHLKSCMQNAKDREDETAAAAILHILHREGNKKQWWYVEYLTGKPGCGQVLLVKVDLEDSLEDDTHEFTAKNEVFLQVKNNISERFCLAFTAPLCSEALFHEIGFLGDTETVQQIVGGTYVFPAGTDAATELLLEEAAITYSKLSQEEVEIYVTADDFQYY